jgi:drug/metabolite transporter (DMT)-like permease
MILDLLQTLGVACGILGAVLTADATARRRRQGFGVWIVANAAWVAAATLTKNPYMLVMFGFYLLTAAKGHRANRANREASP